MGEAKRRRLVEAALLAALRAEGEEVTVSPVAGTA